MPSLCPGPPQPAAWPGTINYPLFDAMTLMHLAVGVALGLFRMGALAALAVAVGWELAEHLLKDCVPKLFVFPSQDSLANAAGDVMATMIAWAAARGLGSGGLSRVVGPGRWRRRRSPG